MIHKLLRLARLALVALVVGCAAGTAAAQPGTGAGPDHTTGRDRARAERPPADPEMGLVWIALGVALLVFMVWVAVRIGDNDR